MFADHAAHIDDIENIDTQVPEIVVHCLSDVLARHGGNCRRMWRLHDGRVFDRLAIGSEDA
jgi:hypothetical protein